MKIFVDDLPKTPHDCPFATADRDDKETHRCNVPKYCGMVCEDTKACPILVEWYDSVSDFK